MNKNMLFRVMYFQAFMGIVIIEETISTTKFEAKIEIIDSENHSDKWHFTSHKSDIDLVNFQLVKMKKEVEERECRREKSIKKANLICGFKKEVKRKKRNLKSSEGCGEDNQQTIAHSALTVALGDVAYLPCMICDLYSELGPKTWFKFSNEKIASETLWFAREVELDKHDNHKLNRIFMTPDNRLIIKDFQQGDSGAYFCSFYNKTRSKDSTFLAFRAESLDETSPIAMAQEWEKFSGYNTVNNMIYVDAELEVQTIIVSRVHGSGYPLPKIPRKNTDANWVMFYQWDAWSPCSSCGHMGERKRRGRCVVRKLDNRKPSSPPFLDHVLKLYPSGATCQSTIFKGRPQLAESPHEIEVDYCDEMCEGILGLIQNLFTYDHAAYTMMRIFGHVKAKLRTNLKDVLKEGDTVTIIRRELETEHLPCPGYHHGAIATWYYNGTQIITALEISNLTNKRITLLPDYTIRILHLSVFDSGRYSCYINQHVTIDIFFTVLARRKIDIPKIWPEVLNFLYFMAPSFALLVVVKAFTDSQSYLRVYAFRTEESRRSRGRKPKVLQNINTNNNTINCDEKCTTSMTVLDIDDGVGSDSSLSDITIDSDYSSYDESSDDD